MTGSREQIISKTAENIIGSEILKLAGEINEKVKNGEKIHNFTVGDFNSKLFPIPAELKAEILKAYENDETNYPPADGVPELRQAVSEFLKSKGGLDYKPEQILIAGGARPIIYGIFRTLVDEGDTVLFPIPSWNNNHYTYLLHSKAVMVETRPENNFMPTAEELKPHIAEANLLSVCSPLNPTGTCFTKEGLEAICDLVLEENLKRSAIGKKPLYVLYDQIYWALTFSGTQHYNPVSLRPEMRDYTVFVDGISKSLAATGVRVGWSMGPKKVMDRMKSIIGHVGAWAPRAEQVAVAKFLRNTEAYERFQQDIHKKITDRLTAFHNAFQTLRKEGYRVNSIAPQGAIYLTVQFALKGMRTPEGKTLNNTRDITSYILNEAKVAIVPFYAFGTSESSDWYRLSVGTAKTEEIPAVMEAIRVALKKLS
ncbi:MAG: aminotransferase class I/II-fold pyridoxal phosphate-dependent enzyme [Bacteroidia bacterium]|nr:aminotransferase class I/II-fold pyridoxal phosphate-dependent enzyme [Bacteroidia bacterium]